MRAEAVVSGSLLDQAQRGDRAALDALLRLHRDGVYRYGLQVCPTTEDAEDAVQLTLWAATRSIGAFRRASSITTWLFTIVHNYCLRFHQGRRSSANELLEDNLADEGPMADAEIASLQLRSLLADALSQLDPLHREAILLRDVEGFTAPEAAAMLNITVPALKSRVHRGREQLRIILAPHLGGDLSVV